MSDYHINVSVILFSTFKYNTEKLHPSLSSSLSFCLSVCLFFFFFLFGRGSCAVAQMWKSEDNSQSSVLYFHVRPGIKLTPGWAASAFTSLSHLASPILLFFSPFETMSCSPGWHQTHCVLENGCWDYRHVIQLGGAKDELRASYMLGKHCTN